MENGQWEQGKADVSSDNEALLHLREAIAQGRHWYLALLEAIELWTLSEETYNGRHYRYLIGGDAFDWLLLAERLMAEVMHLVPEEEAVGLLFHANIPIEISDEEFRHLVGAPKYRAHLNYFYGVTVEEALMLAVEEDVSKEQFSRGIVNDENLADEVYQRLYGASKSALLSKFRKQMSYSNKRSMNFGELKEFTYWLFKYRIDNSDKARIASDTAKGLKQLERQWNLEDRRGISVDGAALLTVIARNAVRD
ncbi:MAG: hypothetical protein U9N44_06815 [Chloroflexota bacterium]|nr:hypothetical protein [Chloroflexota bacterium]